MSLPTEAYPADERASLEQTMQAAQTRAEQGSDTPNPTHDLGDLAATASKILDTEQQASDPEAIRAQLQQKIQTMAEQVYSSLPDGSDKATQMQAFTSRFSIEPSDEDPDKLVIYYHGKDNVRSTMLILGDRAIQGELAVPAELQIDTLFCGGNKLTTLPELPISLTILYCDGNMLASLPELPASLTKLYCYGNLLTTLPELPASLDTLYCYGNKLTTLPELPASLSVLGCYDNQLASLPELPALLTKLYCHGNQLASLPELPTSLDTLYCGLNQLTSLPELPASLIELDCRFSHLASLPELPISLTRLKWDGNPLDDATKTILASKGFTY